MEESYDNQILYDYVCPSHGYWRHERGVVSKAIKIPLVFGDAYHQSLGTLYDGGMLMEALITFEKLFRPYQGLDSKRTLEKGLELVEAYKTQIFDKEEWKDLGGEKRGVLEIDKDTLYVGLLDRVGEYEGLLAPQEWKTTSWYQPFISRPNNQITGYAFITQTLFGIKVAGAIVTVAKIKSSTKGYTPVKTTKAGAISGGESILSRDFTLRETWDYEQFLKDVKGQVGRIRKYREENYWPKQTNWCQSYGGCPYLSLCGSPEATHPFLLAEGFEESRWVAGKGE